MKTDANAFWGRFDLLLEGKFSNLGEFCEVVKLNYNTMISQRARLTIPKIEQLIDMAKALHVSLDFLVSGEDHLDPVYKKLDQNPRLKRLASSMTKCQDLHLSIIETLFFSWGCTEINEPTLLQKRVVSS